MMQRGSALQRKYNIGQSFDGGRLLSSSRFGIHQPIMRASSGFGSNAEVTPAVDFAPASPQPVPAVMPTTAVAKDAGTGLGVVLGLGILSIVGAVFTAKANMKFYRAISNEKLDDNFGSTAAFYASTVGAAFGGASIGGAILYGLPLWLAAGSMEKANAKKGRKK